MIIVMRSHAQNFLRVLFMVGFVASFAVWQQSENHWDYFTFTQQWPVAVCIDVNDSKGTVCDFPKNVKGWTIHGLWPDRADGPDPFYCNSSCPFVENEIKDLEPMMMTRWPSLVANEPHANFWKHEWEKHGTCAMSLPTLDTEHKYFSQTLMLNTKYNLTSILESNGIVPSATKLYDMETLRRTIEDRTAEGGVNLQCIFSEDRSTQALIQIEICIDKSFQPRPCSKELPLELPTLPKWDPMPYNPTYEYCAKKLGVQYLPVSFIHDDKSITVQ